MALMGLLFSAAAALDFIRVTVYGLDSLVLVGYEALDEIIAETGEAVVVTAASTSSTASAGAVAGTDSNAAHSAGVNKDTCVIESNVTPDTAAPTTSNDSSNNNTTMDTNINNTTPTTTIDSEFITLTSQDLNTNIKYIEIKQILLQTLRICATLWEIKDSESSTNGYSKVMVRILLSLLILK